MTPPSRRKTRTQAPSASDLAVKARFEDRRALKGTPPELRVVSNDAGKPTVSLEHANHQIATARLCESLGTNSEKFAAEMLTQISKGLGLQSSEALDLSTVIATLHGLEPRDEVEAMVITQMVVTQKAVMTAMSGFHKAEQMPNFESYARIANQFMRTFANQMEALKRYRSGGEQRVIVQHVNVNDGGQAVVGAINHAPGVTGVLASNGVQPDAKQIAALSSELAVSRPFKANGTKVREPRRAG